MSAWTEDLRSGDPVTLIACRQWSILLLARSGEGASDLRGVGALDVEVTVGELVERAVDQQGEGLDGGVAVVGLVGVGVVDRLVLDGMEDDGAVVPAKREPGLGLGSGLAPRGPGIPRG